LTGAIGVFPSGTAPLGGGVVWIGTAGGTARGLRWSSTTLEPTGEITATAMSVPSGDIEHATRRHAPPGTAGLERSVSGRRLPTMRPCRPCVGSVATTSPLPIGASRLSESCWCSVGSATKPRNAGTAGPLTIVRKAGSLALVVTE
jgi:hypothetical protein